MDESTAIGGAGPRTLKLLECLAEQAPEFTLSEMAAALDLPPSTVHRLLKAFIVAGLIERTGDRAYRTGAELYRIASMIVEKFDLGPIARPALEQLWERWKETTTFSLYRPSVRRGMIREIIRSPNPLQFNWQMFEEFELAWGPQGHAILAFLPDAEIAAVLASATTGPYSGRHLPPRKVMMDFLGDVKRLGYSSLQDEENLNLAGVSAPVFRAGGSVIGSVGVVMPATRFDPDREQELIETVVEAARAVSSQVGAAE